MAHQARICPHCGALNSADDDRCHRCEQRLPGPLASLGRELFVTALGSEFPLTKLYVGLCAAVFVFMMMMQGWPPQILAADPVLALRWGALFGNIGLPELDRLGRDEPWRYLSAMYVHYGVLHILFNGMALVDFGRAVEGRLGSGRFGVAFVLTGVLGFVASDAYFSFTGAPYQTAGASGGLFGLVGLMIGLLVARRDPAWKQFLARFAVIAVLLGVMLPVNNAAHAGGFAAGFPLGYLFGKERRPWKRTRVLNGLAAALVVASVASLALSHASPAWQRLQAELRR